MSINAKCPTCSRDYKFPDSLAGRSIRCNTCGNEFMIPGPARLPASAAAARASVKPDNAPAPAFQDVPAPAAPEPTPRSRAVSSPAPAARRLTDASRPQKLAANIALILGILVFIGGTCLSGIGVTTFTLINNPPPNVVVHATKLMAWEMVGGGFLLVGAAITYFVSSFKIRRGSRPAMLTTLIVAALHEVAVLIWIGNGIVQLLRNGMPAAQVAALAGGFILLQLLLAAAIAQLIYYLSKLLREPH